MKRAKLIKVAEEMNKTMGLDPRLNVKLDDAKLTAAIIASIGEISEDDEFSAETMAALEELAPTKEVEEDEEEVEEEEDEDEDEDDEDDEEEPEEDEDDEDEAPAKPAAKKNLPLNELVAETRTLADLKQLAVDKDEFKKLRKGLDAYTGLSGPKELKAAMYKALGVEPPVSGAPKADDKRVIKLLVKENPKREGTKAFKKYALYKSGMTVADYIKAGGEPGDIPWDVKRNLISLSK